MRTNRLFGVGDVADVALTQQRQPPA